MPILLLLLRLPLLLEWLPSPDFRRRCCHCRLFAEIIIIIITAVCLITTTITVVTVTDHHAGTIIIIALTPKYRRAGKTSPFNDFVTREGETPGGLTCRGRGSCLLWGGRQVHHLVVAHGDAQQAVRAGAGRHAGSRVLTAHCLPVVHRCTQPVDDLQHTLGASAPSGLHDMHV